MTASTSATRDWEALIAETRRDLPLTLRWLASDTVFELDPWLRVPVRDRARFLRDSIALIESCGRDDGARGAGGADPTDAFLGRLAARGEDTGRLLGWIATGPGRFAAVGGIEEPELRWRDTLDRWGRHGFAPPRYVDAARMRALVDGHRREVITRP